MSEPSRIVLSGYYGFGNAGDEAILQATVEGLRRFIPEVEIIVLSKDPTGTEAWLGVRAVHRFRFANLRAELAGPGVLLSGGGGLLQDSTSRVSIYYYLGMISLALRGGMRTMVYAQGLGPLRHSVSRWAVRNVFRRVDVITFRDEASAALLAEMGLPGRAVVTADPAFALNPAPRNRIWAIFENEQVPRKIPLLAVSLRSWPGFTPEARSALGGAIRAAVDACPAHVLFVSMQNPEDRATAEEIAVSLDRPCTVLTGSYTPAELAGILGAARAVVAMRLHALILSSVGGVPGVALSYDPKVEAAARLLTMPSFPVESVDETGLGKAIVAALQASEGERDRVRAAAQERRRAAESNFEFVRELLAG